MNIDPANMMLLEDVMREHSATLFVTPLKTGNWTVSLVAKEKRLDPPSLNIKVRAPSVDEGLRTLVANLPISSAC